MKLLMTRVKSFVLTELADKLLSIYFVRFWFRR